MKAALKAYQAGLFGGGSGVSCPCDAPPSGFYVSTDQGGSNPIAEGTWVEVNNPTGAATARLYMVFNQHHQAGGIRVEMQWAHTGKATNPFWRSSCGMRLTADRNSFNAYGQVIAITGMYEVTNAAMWLPDMVAFYPDWLGVELSGESDGVETICACVTSSDAGRPASVILESVDDGRYTMTRSYVALRWFSL